MRELAINKLELLLKDLKDMQELEKETGKSYFNKVKAAAKTGTSETIYNGIKTITRSLVSYFPYDTPEYSASVSFALLPSPLLPAHVGYRSPPGSLLSDRTISHGY